MPLHDWSRVDAGIFHDFHNVWIAELRNALNNGLLPTGFYALSEQHAGKYVADILTLQKTGNGNGPSVFPEAGGLAVADAPPKVRHKLTASPTARARRKSLAVRHVSGHRLIALIEIVSPANKDRREHLIEFVDKIEDALSHDVNVLLVDVLRPGTIDPHGMHGAIWERLSEEPGLQDASTPCTLAGYVAGEAVKAYVETCDFGDVLPDMPLFLDPDWYINVPLETSYETTWRGTPEHWRNVLDAPRDSSNRE